MNATINKENKDYVLSHIIEREGPVTALSFSPDNTTLAIGGYDYKAVIYETSTTNEIATFQQHDTPAPIYTVSFSADSSKLAVAGYDKKVTIHNVHNHHHNPNSNGSGQNNKKRIASNTNTTTNNHNYEQVLHRTRPINSVAFSQDGEKIAVGGYDSIAAVYDVETGEELYAFKRSGSFGWVNTVTFTHDGNYVIAGGYDKKVIIYNLNQHGKEVHTFERGGSVRSLAMSPDDTQLAVAGNDEKVVLYDFLTGKEMKIFRYDDEVWSVAFSPDGNELIVGDRSGRVVIRDITDGKELQYFLSDRAVVAVGFSPDGKKVAFGGSDNKVHVYNIVSHIENTLDTLVRRLSATSFDNGSETAIRNGASDTIIQHAQNICISFVRIDDLNEDINGLTATVLIKPSVQNITKLSDAIRLIPLSSGVFQLDPETVKQDNLLRIIVKETVVFQAEQCNITIEELRQSFHLDTEFSLGIRFDPKPSYQNASLPF